MGEAILSLNVVRKLFRVMANVDIYEPPSLQLHVDLDPNNFRLTRLEKIQVRQSMKIATCAEKSSSYGSRKVKLRMVVPTGIVLTIRTALTMRVVSTVRRPALRF